MTTSSTEVCLPASATIAAKAAAMFDAMLAIYPIVP